MCNLAVSRSCGEKLLVDRLVWSISKLLSVGSRPAASVVDQGIRVGRRGLWIGALLRRAAGAQRRQDDLVAAGGLGRPLPEWIKAGDDYQRLASIRSWMASRLASHQLRCGLPPRDGVAAWRRDAVTAVSAPS
jgi:hypothetical protein